MTKTSTASGCRLHDWERLLEFHHGVECVVRSCRRCGRKELCWSRRPLSLEATAGADSDIDERRGSGLADKN
jgi:hypothetical protein